MNIAVLDGWKVLNAARMCRNNRPARQRRTGTPGLVPQSFEPQSSSFLPLFLLLGAAFCLIVRGGCEEVGVANTIEHRLPLILWAAASDLLLSAVHSR